MFSTEAIQRVVAPAL
jgi:hypothetical protein